MNYHKQSGLAPIAIILIIAGLLVLGAGAYYWQKSRISAPNQTACPMDAKLCPDGSYVSRTGPNCEFAACPAKILCEGKFCPSSVPTSTPSVKKSTSTPPIVGGKCSYDSFDGQCEITFIEGSNVKFLFTANEPKKVSQTWFNLQDGKTNGEINFSDTNSTTLLSPSQCIEKYGIKINETIDCKLNVENSGTCTPSMIRFDNIGQDCIYF